MSCQRRSCQAQKILARVSNKPCEFCDRRMGVSEYEEYMMYRNHKSFFELLQTFESIVDNVGDTLFMSPPGLPFNIKLKSGEVKHIHITPVKARIMYDHFEIPAPTYIMKFFN